MNDIKPWEQNSVLRAPDDCVGSSEGADSSSRAWIAEDARRARASTNHPLAAVISPHLSSVSFPQATNPLTQFFGLSTAARVSPEDPHSPLHYAPDIFRPPLSKACTIASFHPFRPHCPGPTDTAEGRSQNIPRRRRRRRRNCEGICPSDHSRLAVGVSVTDVGGGRQSLETR